MSNGKGFFTVSWRHMHMPGLTLCESVVLARMGSFGLFFEDVKKTADFLNYSVKTIQTAKQRLLRAGYILEIENNGRGKKYLVRADLRKRLTSKQRSQLDKIREKAEENKESLFIPTEFLDEDYALQRFALPEERDEEQDEEPEEVIEERPENPLRPSTKEAVTRESKADREARSIVRWRKNHPELIPILKMGEDYLKANQIPLLDYVGFRRGLAATARALHDPHNPKAPVQILTKYFEVLNSPEYEYQLEHNAKYTPRITTSFELWDKLDKVRVFWGHTERHYDPSKVLTH